MSGRVTELSGLLRPDGSVIVPGAVAQEVLRALIFALTERARQTGGQPSPAARRLLSDLYLAAQRHENRVDTEEDDEARQVHTPGVTVHEVANVMGCSTAWVRHLLAIGRLAGRKSGGVWVVDWPLTNPQAPQRSA